MVTKFKRYNDLEKSTRAIETVQKVWKFIAVFKIGWDDV